VQDYSTTRFIGIPDHKPVDYHFLGEDGQTTEDDAQVKEVVVERCQHRIRLDKVNYTFSRVSPATITR